MASYILNDENIVLFLNGKPVKVAKDAPVFAAIIKAFRLPKEQQEAAILAALDKRNVNKDIASKGFVVNGSEVTYEGEKLPAPLAQKIVSLIKENLPVELFKNFWANLKKNPSSSSVNELYDFLAYKELPITDDGCFLAYKGLNKDFWSISANKDTKVLKGKVDEQGRIFNGVGEEIEVERNNVDDDRSVGCSLGLHGGSFEYGRAFARGRFVVIKINPKDVVSVPTDCSCQKLRCCAYTVISEIVEEITAPVVDKKNQPVVNKAFKKDNAEKAYIQDRVKKYLEKCANEPENWTAVRVKKIRNIFSPKYPDKKEIISAAQAVGYRWGHIDNMEVIFLD